MKSDEIDTEDDVELENIQLAVNQAIYGAIIDAYQQIKEIVPSADAVGIMVSGVATNLGMVIGQIPDSHRESYLQIAQVILEKSFLSTVESMSYQTYGQVGHA